MAALCFSPLISLALVLTALFWFHNSDEQEPTHQNDVPSSTLTDETVRIEAIPSNKYALAGVKNTIDVLFNIITQDLPNKESRHPLNLAIVLDRSGSMESESKLENSKQSIIRILMQLTPSDIVHFVTYESEVEVVFENVQIQSQSHLEEIINTVQKVRTLGMTNLEGGLEKGIQLVKRARDRTKVFNDRVFLFSDGRANVGASDHQSLFKMAQNMLQIQGISLTTFGLGSDYDEELMRGLADNGGGAYYYIEKSSDIDRFVSRAIDGLLGLVGTQAILTVKGKNDAVITKIWGHQHQHEAQLGDLKESNTRQVLIRLELITQETTELQDILEYTLEFNSLVSPQSTRRKSNLSGTVKLSSTTNEKLVNDSVSAEVQVVLAIQKAAEAEKDILEHLEQGRVEEALEAERSNLENLQQFEGSDPSGQVAMYVSNIEEQIQTIKSDGGNSRSSKVVHHAMYMKNRASLEYTNDYSS